MTKNILINVSLLQTKKATKKCFLYILTSNQNLKKVHLYRNFVTQYQNHQNGQLIVIVQENFKYLMLKSVVTYIFHLDQNKIM